MPENKDKSQDRPIGAPKKPGAAPKAGVKAKNAPKKGADREVRLAEALRANLRRRKAPRRDENAADAADDGSENSPEPS